MCAMPSPNRLLASLTSRVCSRNRHWSRLMVLVAVLLAISTGCASAFRPPSLADAFPDVIKSPQTLSPANAEPFRRWQQPSGEDVVRRAVVVEDEDYAGIRTHAWRTTVEDVVSRSLDHQFKERALPERYQPLETSVSFDVKGQVLALTGTAFGPSEMVIRVRSTLPSGAVVESFPMQGDYFSADDESRLNLMLFPSAFGMSIAIAGLVVQPLTVVSYVMLALGLTTAMCGLGVAAVVEQWTLRDQEERWAVLLDRALQAHTDDLVAASVLDIARLPLDRASSRPSTARRSPAHPPRPSIAREEDQERVLPPPEEGAPTTPRRPSSPL